MDISTILAALNGATAEQKNQLKKALDAAAPADSQSTGMSQADINAALEPFRKGFSTPQADFNAANAAAQVVDGTGFLEELSKGLQAGMGAQTKTLDLLCKAFAANIETLNRLDAKLEKALSAPQPSHTVTDAGNQFNGGSGNPNALESMTAGDLLGRMMKAYQATPASDMARREAIGRAIAEYESGGLPTIEALNNLGIMV